MVHVAHLALQWLGKVIAITCGVAFMSVQALTYTGMLTVNWTEVHRAAYRVLDKTGDG